jgi:hypothetical protein
MYNGSWILVILVYKLTSSLKNLAVEKFAMSMGQGQLGATGSQSPAITDITKSRINERYNTIPTHPYLGRFPPQS